MSKVDVYYLIASLVGARRQLRLQAATHPAGAEGRGRGRWPDGVSRDQRHLPPPSAGRGREARASTTSQKCSGATAYGAGGVPGVWERRLRAAVLVRGCGVEGEAKA